MFKICSRLEFFKRINHLVALSLFTASCSNAAYATKWQIIDLGTLGGINSRATDVSATGVITGSSQDASGEWRAFTYSHQSGMRRLPLPTDTNPYSTSTAVAVNAAGTIVAMDSGGAFMVSHSVVKRLPDLGVDGSTVALGINSRGDIVGASRTLEGTVNAFHFANGQISKLGTLGGDSVATGISDIGRVVGWAVAGGATRAVEFVGDTVVDLGLFPGDGAAYGINGKGIVVGRGATAANSTQRAFWLQDGKLVDLGTSGPSFAVDINDSNDIVGYYYDISTPKAFLFDPSSGLIDLSQLPEVTASGWASLYTAAAINQAGWIVGTGSRGNDHDGRAYCERTPRP